MISTVIPPVIQAHIVKKLHGAQGDFMLDVHLNIAQGELVALYGASGSGKTTLLRCLAGLETPDDGHILVNEKSWFNTAQKVNTPVQARNVGFMFQDYALFPNMTVRQNLTFALRKGEPAQRVDDLLEMMAITQLQHRLPAMLSGGQKQRVALARTLAQSPQILLLDEPLSALDADVRSRLQDEILRLHQHFGLTTILVSHDIGEVYKLANRVLLIGQGKIQQQGNPAEIFSQGQTSGKFKFTGEVLAIEEMDVMAALTVLVANQIVRVVAMPDEAAALSVGSKVMLVSKAFNPMILKLT